MFSSVTVHAEWSEDVGVSVEVYGVILKIGFWAFQLGTFPVWLMGIFVIMEVHETIVKSLQPMSTVVSGQRPLAKPNFHMEFTSSCSLCFNLRAEVSKGCVLILESIVIMMIKDGLLDIVLSEKIVPDVLIVSERVVEYGVGLWSVSPNELSHLSVEILEWLKWSIPPWLIDWLEASKGGVVSPSDQHILAHLETELHVIKVKSTVLIGSKIEIR